MQLPRADIDTILKPLTPLGVTACQDMLEGPLLRTRAGWVATRANGHFGQMHNACTVEGLRRAGIVLVIHGAAFLTMAGETRMAAAQALRKFRAAQPAPVPFCPHSQMEAA